MRIQAGETKLVASEVSAFESALIRREVRLRIDAQQAPAVSISSAPGISSAVDSPTEIDLLVGRSTLLNVGSPITRVSLTAMQLAGAPVGEFGAGSKPKPLNFATSSGIFIVCTAAALSLFNMGSGNPAGPKKPKKDDADWWKRGEAPPF